MKGHEFKHLQAAIQSLTDSTYIRYAGRGVACEITGRRSMYVSRRTVEYSPWEGATAHDVHACVSNCKYRLVIGIQSMRDRPIWTELADGESCVAVEGQVPRAMLGKLITDLREYIQWEPDYTMPLVWVAFGVRRVVGWDAGHKPVFAERPSAATDSCSPDEDGMMEYLRLPPLINNKRINMTTLSDVLTQLHSETWTPAERWVIRWQYSLDMGDFARALAKAITCADGDNLDRLAIGFPTQVEGYRAWAYGDLGRRLRDAGLEI